MSEIFRGGEGHEPTEEDLLRMNYREFRKYQEGVEGKIRSEKDPARQNELLKGLFDFEVKRDQRVAIPVVILTQTILLKYGYPLWRHEKLKQRGETRSESDLTKSIEDEREFLERLRRGEFPEDWTQPLPYRDPTTGVEKKNGADMFWGHCGRRHGAVLRLSSEGKDGEKNIQDLSEPERTDLFINYIAHNFMARAYPGVAPYMTADFGEERHITKAQIEEVAEEIGLDKMVRGEAPGTQQSSKE